MLLTQKDESDIIEIVTCLNMQNPDAIKRSLHRFCHKFLHDFPGQILLQKYDIIEVKKKSCCFFSSMGPG